VASRHSYVVLFVLGSFWWGGRKAGREEGGGRTKVWPYLYLFAQLVHVDAMARAPLHQQRLRFGTPNKTERKTNMVSCQKGPHESESESEEDGRGGEECELFNGGTRATYHQVSFTIAQL
jgi:hypothetical protein